ncbi:RtcB family protein [Sorangium sp. So ce124]|uniref:RtcB family protein n=1 Tax=Sorangium sp. So ce124 TaxID=3133280 RepID=UPI003F5F7AA8
MTGNRPREPDGAEPRYLHRKGATPAGEPEGEGGAFSYTGDPVIVPGSMGDSCRVLAGAIEFPPREVVGFFGNDLDRPTKHKQSRCRSWDRRGAPFT